MQVVGCGPFAAVVVFADGETRRAGPPPRSWERRPRSLVSIRLSVAAQGATPVAAPPRLAQRALGCHRRFTGRSKRPVATGNSGCLLCLEITSSMFLCWQSSQLSLTFCWLPARLPTPATTLALGPAPAIRGVILEMAPLPVRAIRRETQCAHGGVRQVKPARAEGASRPGPASLLRAPDWSAGARHSTARAGFGGKAGGKNSANAARLAVA